MSKPWFLAVPMSLTISRLRCKRHRNSLWVCASSLNLLCDLGHIFLEADVVVGPAFSNAVMAVGPIEHGTVKSVAGYGPEPFEGEIANGADVFHVDASFRSVKLDFRAVIKYATIPSVPKVKLWNLGATGLIRD